MSNTYPYQLEAKHNSYNEDVNFVLINKESKKSITPIEESNNYTYTSSHNKNSSSFMAQWYDELIIILIDNKFIINAILITYICLFLMLIVLNFRGFSL